MPYQYIIHNRIKQSKSFLKIIIKLVPIFSKSSALALRILFCPFTIIQKPIGIANNLNFCPATITAPFFIADCFSRIIRALYIYIEETQSMYKPNVQNSLSEIVNYRQSGYFLEKNCKKVLQNAQRCYILKLRKRLSYKTGRTE